MPLVRTRHLRRPVACSVAAALHLSVAASARAEDTPRVEAKVAPPPAPIVAVPEKKVTPAELPVAGFSGGSFYVRGDDDRWVLFPGGRLQMDGYGFAGQGVSDYQRTDGTGLQPNARASRARVELAGRLDGRYYFWLGVEAGGMKLDGSLNTTSSANVGDAFVGAEFDRLFDVRFGQFDVPFMMANVTSDKYFDLMERPLSVRDVGAPYNKDIGLMIRGETPNEILNYAIALVGGAGQNRPDVGGSFDVDLRLFFRPFVTSMPGPMSRAHVGFSGQAGTRDPSRTWYDVPTMTTPGGFAFWTPTWGKGSALEHVLPSDRQLAIAGELYLPILDWLDLSAEAVYIDRSTREQAANASLGIVPNDVTTGPYGAMTGLSYYVQLALWPYGTPRINGEPGVYPSPKLRTGNPDKTGEALEIVVRWEQLMLDYSSNSRNSATTQKGYIDGGGDGNSGTTNLHVNDLQVGVTYWATKHVRFTAQYSLYMMPGTPNGSFDRLGVEHSAPGTPTNQAVAPGALAGTGAYGAPGGGFDWTANSFSELSVRAAIAL
ncbi:MAG: porin [Polyangiales bacterium]